MPIRKLEWTQVIDKDIDGENKKLWVAKEPLLATSFMVIYDKENKNYVAVCGYMGDDIPKGEENRRYIVVGKFEDSDKAMQYHQIHFEYMVKSEFFEQENPKTVSPSGLVH